MNNSIRIIVLLLGYMSIFACTNLKKDEANSNSALEWDFDHSVQFSQTELAKNLYQLKIIPNNKVNFERLAAFLLRKSYVLCQHYHYKLTILQGIEGFDDKRAMPHYILPSLVANLECNTNTK